MNKGRLFIVSGPSGCGKDTIINQVLKQNSNIRLSISSVTRNMREGEIDGQKYNFISREQFENGLKSNDFLEYNIYLENYYGTPKTPVEAWINEGLDVLLEIDVNGADKVKSRINDTKSIFIMPPSFEILERRLTLRGTEDIETVNKRLVEAKNEMSRAKFYDYIIVNDVLDEAVNDFLAIIKADALCIDRMGTFLNEVNE